MLRIMGVEAATKNRPMTLSAAVIKAAKQIQSVYGINHTARRLLISQFSGKTETPSKSFKTAIRLTTRIIKIQNTLSKTRFKKANAAFCDPFSDSAEKIGTNAEVSAPSPNSRRKRLGIVKARIKAEFQRLAPSAAKIKTSRPKPSIRENNVGKLTEAMFLIVFIVNGLRLLLKSRS